MTYCMGLLLRDGLVMVGDTRTNAGVDNIATFRKLQVFEVPGERVIAIATAGNLAVTQAVISHLQDGLPSPTGELQTVYTVPSMFEMAQFVGRAVHTVRDRDAAALAEDGGQFDCSLLVAGQIGDRRLRLFMVYRAGNFLETTEDTPYAQIGEHKYGKPILDRSINFDTPLDEALKIALISMDSTMRSNLAVGLPVDAMILPRDKLRTAVNVRITEDDTYFNSVRNRWSEALCAAHKSIPDPPYSKAVDPRRDIKSVGTG
ncbi:peptidase [Acuticoccus sp. MNP-M23]|uniref:peptidase n=1 Tax=Acuticoccus sp. MNP-M23 TaxID=3072793 RepID=UPI0028164A8F|nr:peptidase [Acuticoccus sp. MNP-M23]WMS43033.1 peptidase [Acuticoccus sp. MNP-M23]